MSDEYIKFEGFVKIEDIQQAIKEGSILKFGNCTLGASKEEKKEDKPKRGRKKKEEEEDKEDEDDEEDEEFKKLSKPMQKLSKEQDKLRTEFIVIQAKEKKIKKSIEEEQNDLDVGRGSEDVLNKLKGSLENIKKDWDYWNKKRDDLKKRVEDQKRKEGLLEEKKEVIEKKVDKIVDDQSITKKKEEELKKKIDQFLLEAEESKKITKAKKEKIKKGMEEIVEMEKSMKQKKDIDSIQKKIKSKSEKLKKDLAEIIDMKIEPKKKKTKNENLEGDIFEQVDEIVDTYKTESKKENFSMSESKKLKRLFSDLKDELDDISDYNEMLKYGNKLRLMIREAGSEELGILKEIKEVFYKRALEVAKDENNEVYKKYKSNELYGLISKHNKKEQSEEDKKKIKEYESELKKLNPEFKEKYMDREIYGFGKKKKI